MNTKLLLTWAALALLFTACEEEEQAPPPRTYPVRINVGMPSVYGKIEDSRGVIVTPVEDVNIKVYRTKEDYLLDRNMLLQGATDETGLFKFDQDSTGTLWFSAQRDTLSNLRKVNANGSNIEHNEIVIGDPPHNSGNYQKIEAVLTNTPTELRLSIFHEGQAVEDAQVQLYFTEQAYGDSLAAQQDFEQLRPTYGYFVDEEGTTGEERYFIDQNKDTFLQTTNESGEAYFDNLEPRNYWFRITKDTLSNEGTVIRTREALPRDADITTQQEVSIK